MPEQADLLEAGEISTTMHLAAPRDDVLVEWRGTRRSEFQNARYHGLWTSRLAGRELTGTLIDVASKKPVRRIVTARHISID